MQGLGAADETHGRYAVAELVEGFVRRSDDVGVIGEAEVIVGAQVQHVLDATVCPDVDRRLLRPRDDTFGLEKSLGFQGVGLLGERLEKFGWHCDLPLCSKGRIYSKMPSPDIQQHRGLDL